MVAMARLIRIWQYNTISSMNSQKLEEVASFKYLGATLCKDGTCSVEIRIKIISRPAIGQSHSREMQCARYLPFNASLMPEQDAFPGRG